MGSYVRDMSATAAELILEPNLSLGHAFHELLFIFVSKNLKFLYPTRDNLKYKLLQYVSKALFRSKTQNVKFCKSLAWCTKYSRKINRITQMDCKSRDESNVPNQSITSACYCSNLVSNHVYHQSMFTVALIQQFSV